MCTERVLFSFRKMPGDAWQWRRVRKKTFYFWEPDSMKCTGNHFGKYSVITKFGALQKICYELLRFLLHEQLVVNTPNIPLSTSEVSRIRNEFEHKCLKICASEVKNMPIAFRADVEITCLCVMELNETEFCAVSIILHLYRRYKLKSSLN